MLPDVAIHIYCIFLFLPCRVEDEAILDRGASFVKHVCDEEEVEGELSNKYEHIIKLMYP